MLTIDDIIEQMEAIASSIFMKKYSSFESQLKEYYKQNVTTIDNPILYYYTGCLNSKNRLVFKFDEEKIDFSEYSFNKISTSYTNYFTLNEIIKIDKQYKLTKNKLNEITINSEIRNFDSYKFFDMCFKATSMRNKLAHERSSLELKPDKDIIELLDMSTLKNYFSDIYENFDMNNMNDVTKSILSNTVFLDKMIAELSKI